VLIGILLFYAFIILVALTLFNVVLMAILIVLFAKYIKWSYLYLKELRFVCNMREIKKFLDQENQRLYSTRLLRLQLFEG
jgi:Ca2+/Na+ antiporter